jgi:hypothetical protein
MGISKTPENEQFPLWATDQGTDSVSRYAAIPTPEDLRDRLLFGIPLKSALTGQEMSDAAIQKFINSAISEVEHQLDLYITPVTFYEKHDYNQREMNWNYNFLRVKHPNILNVTKVELSFSNNAEQSFVNFPLEFVHVNPEGIIQLVPSHGTSISGFLMSAFAGSQYHALMASGMYNFPGAMRVEYQAGFALDKCPAMLVELIENIAAHRVLSALGPVLFPHSSVSVSVDGVSQSTGSFGPKHLSDRIADIEKVIEKLTDAAKGYYSRRFLIDFI